MSAPFVFMDGKEFAALSHEDKNLIFEQLDKLDRRGHQRVVIGMFLGSLVVCVVFAIYMWMSDGEERLAQNIRAVGGSGAGFAAGVFMVKLWQLLKASTLSTRH